MTGLALQGLPPKSPVNFGAWRTKAPHRGPTKNNKKLRLRCMRISSFFCWNVLELHFTKGCRIFLRVLTDWSGTFTCQTSGFWFTSISCPKHLWEPGLSSSFCRCHLEALEEPNDILSMFLHRSKCFLHINWCRISFNSMKVFTKPRLNYGERGDWPLLDSSACFQNCLQAQPIQIVIYINS